MVKRFCDKCGRQLPKDVVQNVKIGMWLKPMSGDCSDEFWSNLHYDPCCKCCEEIVQMIDKKTFSKFQFTEGPCEQPEEEV